ncbi:LamB/YcsF family protein [Brevibacterium casei]|uniref:LamB/YcsF family protein n=1 Tax=Brevibacterium casei TaxID=33889 RepID=UPI00186B701A|nr:5-oxoprolinase subunit PxpA [Brevibacterium casei]MBE4694836.1 LamB/YcsF family protein [Brevibacterium casei]MBY3577958.1 LamB/YcsF family protein [Brevibacterium casei]MCT1446455.1 LamB/YcsF family protein [Brevibacterium casei]MCT2356963.1 LamB/YcsF family protein [Brevibacterium casei]
MTTTQHAPTIDLNSDLGENVPDRIVSDDEAMLGIVTSANVSCGFHAGSPEGIRATLAEAADRGVVIGAHPGYDDYEGFGRRALDVPAATLQAQVEYQIGALMGLATAVGGTVAYVKPHGGLYNAIVHDEAQARIVAEAVKAVDPTLTFLGLAGSVSNRVAAEVGLTVAAEAFADRAYNPDGSLVSRTEAGAVLDDPALVAARVLRLVETGQIEAIDGSVITVDAQSICFHGDSKGSIEMAQASRAVLEEAGVVIAPFAGARS